MNLVIRDPADVRSVVGEVPAMSPGEVAAAYQRAGRLSDLAAGRPAGPGHAAIAGQIVAELLLSSSTGR